MSLGADLHSVVQRCNEVCNVPLAVCFQDISTVARSMESPMWAAASAQTCSLFFSSTTHKRTHLLAGSLAHRQNHVRARVHRKRETESERPSILIAHTLTACVYFCRGSQLQSHSCTSRLHTPHVSTMCQWVTSIFASPTSGMTSVSLFLFLFL